MQAVASAGEALENTSRYLFLQQLSLHSDAALALHCAASYLKQKLARFSAQHSFKHPRKCKRSSLTIAQAYSIPVHFSLADRASKLLIHQYRYIFAFPFLFSYSKADTVETRISNSCFIPLNMFSIYKIFYIYELPIHRSFLRSPSGSTVLLLNRAHEA